MNNFIKIITARVGHCTANYNLLFSPGMTDFDEFNLFIKIPRKLSVLSFSFML